MGIDLIGFVDAFAETDHSTARRAVVFDIFEIGDAERDEAAAKPATREASTKANQPSQKSRSIPRLGRDRCSAELTSMLHRMSWESPRVNMDDVRPRRK